RTTSSFPVPVCRWIKTETSYGARLSIRRKSARIGALRPPSPWSEGRSWEHMFLEQGTHGLKTRSDPEEREFTLARAKIGELMMGLELAEHLIEKGRSGRVEEAAAMRGLMSPGTGRRCPLTMICTVFPVPRSSVYPTAAATGCRPPVV